MLQCPKVAVIIIDFTNKNRKPDIYRPSGEEVTAEAIKNIIQAVRIGFSMVYNFPPGQIFISSQQLKYFQEIYRRSALNNVASSGNLLLLQN